MIYKIRQETPEDYREVYELVRLSFASAAHSDGTEADYLNEVRGKDTFIPELSLAAEEKSGRLIGQIVMQRTNIAAVEGDAAALVISPVCVHPEFFRKGIARAMIKQASEQALSMGYAAVFLCGDPQIYQRLGFRPSYEFSVFHKDDPSAPWCMCIELAEGALQDIEGTIDIV